MRIPRRRTIRCLGVRTRCKRVYITIRLVSACRHRRTRWNGEGRQACSDRRTTARDPPALSLNTWPSYARLNVATCASLLNAMYAREGIPSLPILHRDRQVRTAPTRHRTRACTHRFVRSLPGWYDFQVTASSVTHAWTLCQKISSGRLGGRRRTTVLRRSVPFRAGCDLGSFCFCLRGLGSVVDIWICSSREARSLPRGCKKSVSRSKRQCHKRWVK